MPNSPDYAALVDASPYPYLLIDKALTIIGANSAYLHATGRSRDIIGLPLFKAFPANPANPDATDVAAVAASIEQAILTKLPHNIPFLRYAIARETPQGTVFDERYWSAVHTPVMGLDGEVAFVSQNAIDVTELYRFDRADGLARADAGKRTLDRAEDLKRAQMHEALKRMPYIQRSHLTRLFNRAPGFSDTQDALQARRESDERLREGMLAARMVVWDMDLLTGDVVFSDNATAVLGRDWTSVEAVWASLHPDDVLKLHAARQRAIAERSEYREIVRLLRPAGQGTLWLNVKGQVRCDGQGVPVAIRGVSVDISERMQAEQDLRDADRRKDEFLAMLAHELRNPLAPISAAAQLLKMPSLRPELVRKTSEIISRQVSHMTSLVDDLLDVSRVTRGLIGLERKRLCVMEIVTDAIEQVRPLINSRKQDLSVSLPPERIELTGDQKRLVQVLTNLLNNAAKYTPEGGQLSVAVQTDASTVTISIRDNGIGMTRELLPHVFDLFTQAERTPDRSQGGLGLGLALVRSLVSLHGGKVSADSDGQGCGSVFAVQLPRLAQDNGKLATQSESPQSTRRDRPLRLLVVDDNTDAAEMLGAFMESAGHRVSIEYEPFQAMERARLEAPDVCLLDIGLPGMDGNQLARSLRCMPHMSRATLIAVTGYGKEFDRDTSIAAGFDYYFVKPADPVALIALLEKIDAH